MGGAWIWLPGLVAQNPKVLTSPKGMSFNCDPFEEQHLPTYSRVSHASASAEQHANFRIYLADYPCKKPPSKKTSPTYGRHNGGKTISHRAELHRITAPENSTAINEHGTWSLTLHLGMFIRRMILGSIFNACLGPWATNSEPKNTTDGLGP